MLPGLEKNENIEKEIHVLLLFEKWNILHVTIFFKKTALPTCLGLKNCVNL